jgi:acetyl-CoA synthetase
LSLRSDAVAAWLTGLGVSRGDRVLAVLGSQQELWETLLACLKVGAVAIPTYTSLTEAEAADRIRRGRIQHLICRAELVPLFAGTPLPGLQVAVPCAGSGAGSGAGAGWVDYVDSAAVPPLFVPDGPTPAADVAFCYFTSGTTSAPKLVAHSHASYPIGHLSSLYWNGLLPGDRHLNVSAPGWAKHSWSSLFVPWNAEATILALPDGIPAADRIPGLLQAAEATSFCAPPSVWHAIRPHLGSAVPRLREATSAGEPLTEELAAEVARTWQVTVRDGYGQTETTGLVGTTPGLPGRPGWLGRPLPGYRISLRDPETGTAGEVGELCVELSGGVPLGLMAGYLDDPERTVRAVGRGWYGTGDVGERDAAGWIRIWGRRDDVFKSFGHRISPYELEAVLGTHPAVAEVAVVPAPHPVGGSVPRAVVVPRRGRRPRAPQAAELLAAELLAHAAERLAPELRPASVSFVDALPRTSSGKIRRSALTAPDQRTDSTDLTGATGSPGADPHNRQGRS